MKVLIIGATGHVGGFTLKAALEAGHEVTAFGRSIDHIEEESPRLTKFKGDAMEAADLARAVPGHDAVILTHGAPLNADTLLHQPELMEESTKLIVATMQAAGVPRLVCMTSIGAGDSAGHGRFVFRNVIEPVLLGRIMKDRTAQEEVVKAAGLPEWVIVRPTELSDDPSSAVRIITDLEAETDPTTIAREDVGRTLVRMLTDKQYDGKAITITNDPA